LLRPTVWTDPLRDMQRLPPCGRCPVCGAELYGEEAGRCPQCRRPNGNEEQQEDTQKP